LPVLANTPLQVIQLPAGVALKMVMMFFTGHFVARRVAMCFGRLQPSFLNQRLDVWVLPDAWRRASRGLVLSLGLVGFLLILCLTRLVGALA